jgi:hypothetical protein
MLEMYNAQERVEIQKADLEYRAQETRRLHQSFARFKSHTDQYCERIGIPKVDTSRSEYDEIQRVIAAQELDMRTCDLCQKVCATMNRMFQHRDSKYCKIAQASQKGQEYIEPGREMVHCHVCNIDMMQRNYRRHCTLATHMKKQKKSEHRCEICDITFSGKRPKRDLKKHLQTTRHKKKAINNQ